MNYKLKEQLLLQYCNLITCPLSLTYVFLNDFAISHLVVEVTLRYN